MKFKEFLNKINESGPFSYGQKKPRKGTVAYNAMIQRKKDKTPPIEPKDQMVGVAKVVKEQSEEKTPEYYLSLAKKHAMDGQKGTRANMVYASGASGRARRAAEILKKGGSQEDAWKHYQGTDKE
jgi:hypothetical protein